MLRITLPDGNIMEFDASVTGLEVARRIGEGLAKAALAVRIDGQLRDLNTKIEEDTSVEIITYKSDDKASLDLMRHSCAHVMADAICRLFPDTQLVYGPTVENGFYYDIDLDRPISPDDFAAIEAEMARIVKAGKGALGEELPGEYSYTWEVEK